MERYSIWVLPKSLEEKKLTKIILSLREGYDSTPLFPHISLSFSFLCSTIMAEEAIKDVAKRIVPFKTQVLGIGTGEKVHKQVFLRLQRTQGLEKLNQKLKKAFAGNIVKEGEFDPHISLIYADRQKSRNFSEKQKSKILLWLKNEEIPKSILAGSIWLIHLKTDDPKDWKALKEFKFEKKS
ncbi:MAG: 2'-5' RNA ligase family protein [archaeon]